VTVAEMQRSRLLGSAVLAGGELGWSGVTVAGIASRARVSRRTFYDLFDDREDCLLEALRDTVDRIAAEIAVAMADEDGLSWRERLRTGLWVILSFFDREPELARFCVLASAQGGAPVLEYRAEVFAALAEAIDEGRLESARAADSPRLSAEGLVGGAFSVLQARLLGSEQESLRDLFGDLMGLLVLPYLGARAARLESARTPSVVPDIPYVSSSGVRAYRAGEDPLEGIPMRLTYRTALVLGAVAQNPGASNRLIGEQADIFDQGQMSRLLARLERIGLLANTGEGHTKGEPNAWRLTPLGERVTEHLSLDTQNHEDAA
jgi:AcrR family transcriptional regulator